MPGSTSLDKCVISVCVARFDRRVIGLEDVLSRHADGFLRHACDVVSVTVLSRG